MDAIIRLASTALLIWGLALNWGHGPTRVLTHYSWQVLLFAGWGAACSMVWRLHSTPPVSRALGRRGQGRAQHSRHQLHGAFRNDLNSGLRAAVNAGRKLRSAGGGIGESYPENAEGSKMSGAFLRDGRLAMVEHRGLHRVARPGE